MAREQEPGAVESEDLAQEILAYLAVHPNAQDTVEGIVQWWLLEQAIKRSMAQVKSALEGLVAEGLIVEGQEKDGRTHYRINRRQIARIRALLEQLAARRPIQ